MNRKLDQMLATELTSVLSESVKAEAVMLHSAEGLKNKETKEGFANIIRKVTEDAKTVEDLVYAEMFLQTLDKEEAVIAKDRTGIENAQTAYK